MWADFCYNFGMQILPSHLLKGNLECISHDSVKKVETLLQKSVQLGKAVLLQYAVLLSLFPNLCH